MPTTNICFALEEYGDRYVKLINYARELGLGVLPRSCLVYPKNTVLLADLPLRKTVRVVSAVASGIVILPVRYLLECNDARTLLPIDSFEWLNGEKAATSTRLILEASEYWRQNKCAPLQQILVHIVGGSETEIRNHEAIVQAAQGTFVTAQPLTLEERRKFLVVFLEKEGSEYLKWKQLCIEHRFACCSSQLLFEMIIMRRMRDIQRYIPFTECIPNTLDILGKNLRKEEIIMKRRKRSMTISSSSVNSTEDLWTEHRKDSKLLENSSREGTPKDNILCSLQNEVCDNSSQSASVSSKRISKSYLNDSKHEVSEHDTEYVREEDQLRPNSCLDDVYSVSNTSSTGSESSCDCTDESNIVDAVLPIIDNLKTCIQETPKVLRMHNILRVALRNIIRNYQCHGKFSGARRQGISPLICLFEMENTASVPDDATWNIPLAIKRNSTDSQSRIDSHLRTEMHFTETRRHRLQKIAKQWTKEKVQSWSTAQITAWLNRHVNANAYYYRHTDPGDGITQSLGKWDEEEQQLFFAEYERWKRNGWRIGSCWGIFSLAIPRRVGYQCSNFYRDCVREGILEDPTYAISVEDGGVLKRLHPEREDKSLVPPPEELNRLSERWEWPEVKEMEERVDHWLQEIHPKFEYQMREVAMNRKSSRVTNRNVSSVLKHHSITRKRKKDSSTRKDHFESFDTPVKPIYKERNNSNSEYNATSVDPEITRHWMHKSSSNSGTKPYSRQKNVHSQFSKDQNGLKQFQEHIAHLVFKPNATVEESKLGLFSHPNPSGRRIESILLKLKTKLTAKETQIASSSMNVGRLSSDYEKTNTNFSCNRKSVARRLRDVDSVSNDHTNDIHSFSFKDCISITEHQLTQMKPSSCKEVSSGNAEQFCESAVSSELSNGASFENPRIQYIRKLPFPSLSKLSTLFVKYSKLESSYSPLYELDEVNLLTIPESCHGNIVDMMLSHIRNYFSKEVYSCEAVARFLKGFLELHRTEGLKLLENNSSSQTLLLESIFPSLLSVSRTQRIFLLDCYLFTLELAFQGIWPFFICHVIFMDLMKFLLFMPDYLYQSEAKVYLVMRKIVRVYDQTCLCIEESQSFWSKFNDFVQTFIFGDTEWLSSQSMQDKVDYCLFLMIHFSVVYCYKSESELINFSSVTNLPTEVVPSNWEMVLELLKNSTCFTDGDIFFPERSYYALYVCAYLSLYWCPEDVFLEWLLSLMNSHLKSSLETGKQISASCCFDAPNFLKETLDKPTRGPPFVAFSSYSRCYITLWFIRTKAVWLYQSSSAVQKQFCSQLLLLVEDLAGYSTSGIHLELVEVFQCICRHLSCLIFSLTGICDDALRLNAFKKLWRPIWESLPLDYCYFPIFSLFLDIYKLTMSHLDHPDENASRIVTDTWLFLSRLMKEYKECFLIISERSSNINFDTGSVSNGMKKDILRKRMTNLEQLVHKLLTVYFDVLSAVPILCKKILKYLFHSDFSLFEAHPLFLLSCRRTLFQLVDRLVDFLLQGITLVNESSCSINATDEEVLWDTLVLSVDDEAFSLAKEYGMELYNLLTPLFTCIISRFLSFFCLQKNRCAYEVSSNSGTLPVPTLEDCNYIVKLSADLFCLLSRLGIVGWKVITKVTIDCSIHETAKLTSRESLWSCIMSYPRFQITFWKRILESDMHKFVPAAVCEEFDFCVIITWLSLLCGWESYAGNVLQRDTCVEDMKLGEMIIQKFPRLSHFIEPVNSAFSLRCLGSSSIHVQVDALRSSLFAWTCHQLECEWRKCEPIWSNEYLSIVPYVVRQVIQNSVNFILKNSPEQQRSLRASYLGFACKVFAIIILKCPLLLQRPRRGSLLFPLIVNIRQYLDHFAACLGSNSQREKATLSCQILGWILKGIAKLSFEVDADIQRLLTGIIRTCLSQLNSSCPVVEGLVVYRTSSLIEQDNSSMQDVWDSWYFASSCDDHSRAWIMERIRKLRLWCLPILNSFILATERPETISTAIQTLRSISYLIGKYGNSFIDSSTWLRGLIPCLHSVWKILLSQNRSEIRIRNQVFKMLDSLLYFPLHGVSELFELFVSFYRLVGYYVLKELAQPASLTEFRKTLKRKIQIEYDSHWKLLVKNFVHSSESMTNNGREDYTVFNALITEELVQVASQHHQNSLYEWKTLEDSQLGWYVIRHFIQRYSKCTLATEWMELLSCLVDHFEERRAKMIRKEVLQFAFQKQWTLAKHKNFGLAIFGR